MKNIHWFILFLCPVVSVAQSNYHSVTPTTFERPSIKTKLHPSRASDKIASGKIFAANKRFLTKTDYSVKSASSASQLTGDQSNLLKENQILLEKIKTLSQYCSELDLNNQLRKEASHQQRALQTRLEEQISQLKQTLLQD